MQANKTQNFVEHLSWDKVSARIAYGASAILPIGAGAKEHGLHLPMNADRIQAESISEQLADRIDALIWPTLAYGYYPAFVEYAGSCSLSESTFENIVVELVQGLLDYECRSVFILNTGISTIAAVDRAIRRLGDERVAQLRIYDGPQYKNANAEILEQLNGSHADEAETSLLLSLAPDVVKMKHAEASPGIVHPAPGALSPSKIGSPNYSRSGSFGDPTRATQSKGDILLAAMMYDLLDAAEQQFARIRNAKAL
ncbi:MAG: creatininase family protein [Rhizobiales bacterium]|nr:creatininase family protein [Hyphomicrobiales bacterium]